MDLAELFTLCLTSTFARQVKFSAMLSIALFAAQNVLPKLSLYIPFPIAETVYAIIE